MLQTNPFYAPVLCCVVLWHSQLVARLLKFNNEVVYEHLLTPEVPFELDYCEVVFSLCDVMCRIYSMFMEEVRHALLCQQYIAG